jgi:hypothetical protein
MGISLTKQRLFFHKVTFIINTISPLVHGTLYAGRVKFFAEASELFMNAVFQLVLFRKTESLECNLQEAKKMEVGGVLKRDCREDEEGTVHPIVATASLVLRLVCGQALSCRRT